MNNKIESWEEGLSERMKEHEFLFDAEALAGFETLLATETAVAASKPTDPAITTGPKSGITLSGKLLSLLAGLVLIGGLAYLVLRDTSDIAAIPAAQVPEEVVSPIGEKTDKEEAEEFPASPTRPAPAAAPQKSTPVVAAAQVVVPPAEPLPTKEVERQAPPRPMPIAGYEWESRKRVVPMVIAPLSRSLPVEPLVVPLWVLPEVRITPDPAFLLSRNRKALFPEVIDNRP